jgi:D-glycero-D-manno-heptose 1,7-bisphosphate phosphatase
MTLKNTYQSKSPRPCVFLDRDGTISKEAGYINHPLRLELLPGVGAAIRKLNDAGVLVIVVTNQAGIARGYFTEAVLDATHKRMRDLLKQKAAHIDALYYAPCHASAKDPRWRDDPFEMRKPGLGMIRQAQQEHAIDMARSVMIGDRMNDVAFGHKAGLPSVFVKTGYGLGEWTYERATWTEQPDYICDTLGQAVAWYLKRLRQA